MIFIVLVNPAATSLLIHTFVFGWAAEWVFFIVEITAIFVYFYCFDRMDARTHQIVGWIYFIAAWLSLFLINGIVGFMLTPGDWVMRFSSDRTVREYADEIWGAKPVAEDS